ncbi:hypothetical protein ACFRR7_17885 [Streptomyces sp. NPDC056909]|uniref:hypothetical protein n=1 Tax=Streptomyces sp. NPDC056909 TaxID=3345963 RepID=UPI003681EF0F
MRKKIIAGLGVAATAVALWGAPAAQAQTVAAPSAVAADDSFMVWTTDLCGSADFIDYGEGAPGGGSNDDYIEVWDTCGDGHGVRAYAWLDGTYLGSKYNGNGNLQYVVWDPFGNVTAGQSVGLKICLVDGANDTTPSNCDESTRTSEDG